MFLSLYMSVHFTSTINSVAGKSVIRATPPVFEVSEVFLPAIVAAVCAVGVFPSRYSYQFSLSLTFLQMGTIPSTCS